MRKGSKLVVVRDLAERTPYSINSFILERLTEEIEEEVARLTE